MAKRKVPAHEQAGLVVPFGDTFVEIDIGVRTEVFTTGWGTARSLKLGDMPCAGKTGTTNDYKDGWFCGYTPYYTTAIWVGNDQPVTIYGLQGASYPGHIWQNFMLKVNKGKEPKEFPEPVKVEGEIREVIGDDEAEETEEELKKKKEEDEQQAESSEQTTDQNTATDNTQKTDTNTDNTNQNNQDQNKNTNNSDSGNDSGNSGNTDNNDDTGDDSGDEPETPPTDERDDSE